MHGLIFLAFRESDDCLLLAQAPPVLPTYTHPTRVPPSVPEPPGQCQSWTGAGAGLLCSSGAWERGSWPHTCLPLSAERLGCFMRGSVGFGKPMEGNMPLARQSLESWWPVLTEHLLYAWGQRRSWKSMRSLLQETPQQACPGDHSQLRACVCSQLCWHPAQGWLV